MGMTNGDMNNGMAPNGILPNQHQILQQQQQLRKMSPPVKKPITPYDDTRSDLMKAIRDGELSLSCPQLNVISTLCSL